MTTSNIKVTIPCDIQKVWETVVAVENHHTWRSDVSKTEVIDEKHFIEHTEGGYSTTCTITAVESCRRWEFDVDNDHVNGHWAFVFEPKGNETEIDVTVGVTAKKLSIRPVGKSVFEQMYLKREMKRFVTDLTSEKNW